MIKVSESPAEERGKPERPLSEGKVPKETVLEYLKVFGFNKTLSEAESQQFVRTALANNLDPFKRETYVAVYGEGSGRKVTILTGYQVYLKRAERTGNLDGWRARIEGDGDKKPSWRFSARTGRTDEPYGLSELLVVMELSGVPLCAEDLGWRVCPAINAAGRMGSADKAVNLFPRKRPP